MERKRQVKELIEINNLFNRTGFGAFRANDQDILMAIFAEFTQTRTGSVQITYDTIRRSAKMRLDDGTNIRDFTKRMVSLTDKAMGFGGVLEISPGQYLVTRLFQEFLVNQQTKTVTATLNPRFKNYFADNKKNFTLLVLPQFIGLKTKYGKNLYRNLCQYAGNRASGYWTVKYDEYKNRMAFPASQVPGQVWRATQKAIREILESGEFLKIVAKKEYDNSRHGRPIDRITFSFEKNMNPVDRSTNTAMVTLPEEPGKGTNRLICPHCGKEMVIKTNKTTGETFLGHKNHEKSKCKKTYPSIDELEKDREAINKALYEKKASSERAKRSWAKTVKDHEKLLNNPRLFDDEDDKNDSDPFPKE